MFSAARETRMNQAIRGSVATLSAIAGAASIEHTIRYVSSRMATGAASNAV
jgi:hypothetical protein